jgi:D-threo-aldose 1-dehydrogenase
MQQFFLDGTAVKTSALAFGCAGLFREPSPRRRSEILHGALDLGITHFDVAPMYGMGLAESELGAFAKGQRSGLTITTKFGIAPSRVGGLIGRVQRPVREFMKAVPAARAQAQTAAATPDAGRLGAILYQSVGFDGAGARKSLERSLRALRTDYVDLLLLHDPRPGDLRSDDVRAYLEHAKTAGLIRAWGLSGDQNDVSGSLRELSSVPVLQVRYPESPSLPPSRAGRIHFGVLNYAVETVVPALRSHTDRQLEWRDALGVDLTAPEAIASLAIQQALAEYPDSVVLFSSTSPAHVRAAAQAASQAADPDALLTFERLLAEVRS